MLSNTALAPRLGFAFDVAGDHKTVLRAHYGRYYDALFGGQFEFMDLTHQNPHITSEVVAPNQFVELKRRSPATNLGIDPNIRQSYVNQVLIGVERQLIPDLSLTAQYIMRNFKDFMGFVDTGSNYVATTKPDPGADNRIGTSDDGPAVNVFNLTNPGHEFLLFTNPANAFRDYNGFQLIGTKRFSHNWQASLSYTWSHAHGTVDNRGGTNAGGGGRRGSGRPGGFTDPNHTINIDGDMRFDPTHALKIDGTYRVPLFGGFNISAVYRYNTGLAWGRTASIRGLAQGTKRSASSRSAPSAPTRSTMSTSARRRRSRSDRRTSGRRLPRHLQPEQPGRDRRRIADRRDRSVRLHLRPAERLDQPAARAARSQIHLLNVAARQEGACRVA